MGAKGKLILYAFLLFGFLLFRLFIHLKPDTFPKQSKTNSVSEQPVVKKYVSCVINKFASPSEVIIQMPGGKPVNYTLAGCYYPEILSNEYDMHSILNDKFKGVNAVIMESEINNNYVYLYINDMLINEYVIGHGLSLYDDTTTSKEFTDLFLEAQNYAEKKERGLWGLQFTN